MQFNYKTKDYNLVANTIAGSFGIENDYIRITILDSDGGTLTNITPFYSGSSELILKTPGLIGEAQSVDLSTGNDFPSYYDSEGNIYLKPNEILAEKEVPNGNYKLQLDFLNQFVFSKKI